MSFDQTHPSPTEMLKRKPQRKGPRPGHVSDDFPHFSSSIPHHCMCFCRGCQDDERGCVCNQCPCQKGITHGETFREEIENAFKIGKNS